MPTHPLINMNATELATLVRRQDLSAREAVEACLTAIASMDETLHAFVALCPEDALSTADTIDRRIANGEDPGPLSGVPVAIKDLLSTAGLVTTFGSRHYAEHIPDEDDIAVARLRAAGAIIIGKTNTSEFGYGAVPHNKLFPATRNPWNPLLGPGGSSAGSAAAVAAGLVPVALGSDGGGSIRVPAALTGLVGFKPSWGRVPVYPGCRDERMPGASSWESLEHIGPLTRTVADAHLLYSVLAGPSTCDRHSLPIERSARPNLGKTDTLRIAYSQDMGFAAVDPEVSHICKNAAEALAHVTGAILEHAHPAIGDVQSIFETIVALDTDRAGLKRMRAACDIGYDPILTALLDTAWTADQFTEALLQRKRVSREMTQFMQHWNVLATPATASAAVPIDQDYPSTIAGKESNAGGFTPFSAMANLTGQPAITLPAGITADGRPVGLQLVGRHLGDETLLRLAAALETERPFPVLLDESD